MEKKIYELGYLLTPLIPAEQVADKASELRLAVIGLEGEVTGELAPSLKPLAYKVPWASGHKRENLTEAYFGAIRFSLEAGVVIRLETKLKSLPEVVRYLIVILPTEAAQAPILRPRRTEVTYHPPVVRPEAPKAKVKLTTEEMDKQIEELIHVSE